MEVTPSLLSAFAPFQNLASDYLQQIVESAQARTFSKGALIFKRGKSLDELFYLINGDLDLIDSQFNNVSLSAPKQSFPEPLNGWDTVSSVSAVAKGEVLLLVVSRDALDKSLAWSESQKIMTNTNASSISPEHSEAHDGAERSDSDWMSALLQSPLFYHVPPANIQQLFACFEVQEVEADEVVIRENERGEFFYVIESGGAIVVDKQYQILAALKPGQYFGEEALVGNTTRNATVKMLTPGRLMRLNKDTFRDLLQEPSQRFLEVDQLNKLGDKKQILDVRLPMERRHGWVIDSTNIPLGNLRKQMHIFESECVYVVADDAGQRASVAAHLLTQAGFDTYILRGAQALHSR